MQLQKVLVEGRQVSFWEINPEEPVSLVMLHGFRGSREGLRDISLDFPHHRVIVVDRPGYGDSDPLAVEHSIENYADWLDGLVRALDLGAYITLGHSSGAAIALAHCARSSRIPVAMIVIAPADLSYSPFIWLTDLYYRTGTLLPYGMRKRWISSSLIQSISDRAIFRTKEPHIRRAIKDLHRYELSTLRPDVVIQEYSSLTHIKLDEYAPSVRAPTLVVAGKLDGIIPLERMEYFSSSIPNAELLVLDGGHMLPLERPKLTSDGVKQYLESLNIHPETNEE